jgi:hypothetical protein
MPMMQKGVAALSDRMPKVISPQAHAIADYVTLGGLLLMSAVFWKRNKPAAVASLFCAAGEATNTLLTDYPGGVTDKISFPTHGKIDMGLAATYSALPNFMGFEDEPGARYFRIMGLGITALTALTYFEAPRKPAWRGRRTA